MYKFGLNQYFGLKLPIPDPLFQTLKIIKQVLVKKVFKKLNQLPIKYRYHFEVRHRLFVVH
jgi:hypothetical protein